MTFMINLKNFFLKIWSWIIQFFTKKKIVKQKNNKKKSDSISQKNTFKVSINRNEELSGLVIATYPGIFPKEIENINKKIDVIKKKIIGYNDENINDEIRNIEDINMIINKGKVLVNQIDDLNDIIDLVLNDEELQLNTNEKINILKDSITMLFDDNLKDNEKAIIKKAYYDHDKVNYIIVTTMLIDELDKELEKIYENYNKNYYNEKTFIDRIKEIERKLERLERINERIEVEKEIEILKKDLYTKRKDKYDLLYNNEIFINFRKRCDTLLKNVEQKDKIKNSTIITKNKESKSNEIGKEELKKEKNKDNKEKKEELEEKIKQDENIIKRFMDLDLARRILIKRELEMNQKTSTVDVLENTLNNYLEFLYGDENKFNFNRNKIKLEVSKLYNDTLRNISAIEKIVFVPIEHINIKLIDLVQETINNQQYLNNLIVETKNINLEENEISIKTTQKLDDILEHEKQREESKDKPKQLIKNYSPLKAEINNKNSIKNNIKND